MATTTKDTSPKQGISTKALSTLEQLNQLRLQVAELEKQQEEEQRERLKGLPAELGYTDAIALVRALLPFCRGKVNITEDATIGAGVKRGRIPEDIKSAIVDDLRKGGLVVREIAAKFGVSTATVNGLKKKAGLIKK
jgi:hypothetical protein